MTHTGARTGQRESPLVRRLREDMRLAGLPEPTTEYQFESSRKWKADLAYPSERLLIEVEGGTYQGGRHTSVNGFVGDCEKYNTAAILGYRLLRFTAVDIQGGTLTKTKRVKGCGVHSASGKTFIGKACADCSCRKGRGCAVSIMPRTVKVKDRIQIPPRAVPVIVKALGRQEE